MITNNAFEIKAAQRGSLGAWSERQVKAVAGGTTSGIRRRTLACKKRIRGQVESARLGKLKNAVRSELKDQGGRSLGRGEEVLNPYGRITSKAIVKARANGSFDLIQVFDQGAIIKAHGATWLCIPNRSISRKVTPKDFAEGALFFKKVRGQRTRGVLCYSKNPRRIAFFCRKSTKLKKRLRVQSAYDAAVRGLSELVAREIERRIARAAVREGLV